MSEGAKKKKKKKVKEVDYGIDPSLPPDVQKRLRKQFRAEKRAEREARRAAREAKQAGLAVPASSESKAPKKSPRKKSPQHPEKLARPTMEMQKRLGSMGGQQVLPVEVSEGKPLKTSSEQRRELQEREEQEAAELKARQEAEAREKEAEARAASKRKAAEARAREVSLEHRAEMAEAEKERRAQELLAEEERRKIEAREMEAARRRAEKAAIAAREAREEAEKREKARRKNMEKERARREAEELLLAERRKQERIEWEALREQRAAKRAAEQEARDRERREKMNDAERAELERQEEERWRREELRQREKQQWVERQRVAVEEVYSNFDSVVSSLRGVDRGSSRQRAEDAGKTSNEWMYQEVSLQHLYAQSTITQLAKHANYEMGVPEVEVRGVDGLSKGLVVDCLLGMPLFKGLRALRPVEVYMIQDMQQEFAPLVKFMADSHTPEKEVQVFEMPKELKTRNTVPSQETIVVEVRYKLCWDVTIVASVEEEMEEPAEDSSIVIWAGPAEEPVEQRMLAAMQNLRGTPSCTILAFTGLHRMLEEMVFGEELNSLLSRPYPAVQHVFYTSPVSGKVDHEELRKQHELERAAFRRLRAQKPLEVLVGMPRLLSLVQTCTSKLNQTKLIPEFLAHFEGQLAQVNQRSEEVARQLEDLTAESMRGEGSAYFAEYVRAFSMGIKGALRGDTVNNGQTSEQERVWNGPWRSALNQPVEVDPSDVPSGEQKLYGSAQFSRLMREFQLAVESANFADYDRNLAANAAPGRYGRPEADFARAGASVATQRFQHVVKPLMDQMLQRALDVARRLTHVAHAILNKNMGGKRFPDLLSLLDSTARDFIEQQGEKAARLLQQELRNTEAVSWSFGFGRLLKKSITSENRELRAITSLADSTLDELKSRVAQSAQMQMHEHFWMPLESELPKFVMRTLAELDNDDVAAKMDIEGTRTSLLVQQATLSQKSVLYVEYLKQVHRALNELNLGL